MNPKIVFINKSTVVSDTELLAIVEALKIQVDRDFAPAWYGYRADLSVTFGAPKAIVPAGAWPIFVMDTSDQQGALGYHEELKDGRPVGFVFAKDVLAAGDSFSVTASHELLEMLADPGINRVVESADGRKLFAMEVCDACEDDRFSYPINGVQVSDFVTPAWFEMAHGKKGVYDFEHAIGKPFQLLAGGYIGVRDIGSAPGWTQLTKSREGADGINNRNSRRHEIRKARCAAGLADILKPADVPEPILQYFAYEHLPERLQLVSRPIGDLARDLVATLPRNPERTVALRKLLEAKDAAVRANLCK